MRKTKQSMETERKTNGRYKHFRQRIFTAGDHEQFLSVIREKRKNMTFCERVLSEGDAVSFFKYGDNWMNTFSYIFDKMKKGIYVQIVDNRINIFLPFSNANYTNHYPQKSLQVNPAKYKDFKHLCEELCKKEGRQFTETKINRFSNKWYCNNGLVRYEFPIQENDSGVDVLYSMFKKLCATRQISDCEFFLNKRDFPILRKDLCDPYDALVGDNSDLGWKDKDFIPIISMCSREGFADLMCPTWEDWMRGCYQNEPREVFMDYKGQHKAFPDISSMDWENKIPKIVFRGASTGLGVTTDTNPRLFFSQLTQRFPDILDIGITKWNLRPRKCRSSDYLDIISDMHVPLVDFMTPETQSRYRYILHLPGHSCAYRLGYELSFQSVIFMYPCAYKLWYSDMLVPYEHYVPIEGVLDQVDLLKKYEWCEQNPERCKEIAKNARLFFEKYLRVDGMLDYCQQLLDRVNRRMLSSPNANYYDLTVVQKDLVTQSLAIQKSSVALNQFSNILRESQNTTIKSSKVYGNAILKINKTRSIHHEYLVGMMLNTLRPITPSFIRTLDLVSNDSVLMEYNPDFISLETFLAREDLFSFHDLVDIFRQILFSLQLSQKMLGFMHFDLCPWNVLLFPNEKKMPLYFRFPSYDMVVTNCNWIVKIIDFDKSHVVCSGISFRVAVPFFRCVVQDVKCFWYHCASLILKKYKLSRDDMRLVIEIIQCLSGKKFSRVGEIKAYLVEAKRYCNLSRPCEETMKVTLSQITSIFKDQSNIQKKVVSNMKIYQNVTESILDMNSKINDTADECNEEEYDFSHDYLRPDNSINGELYPMMSPIPSLPRCSQYDYIYKCICFLNEGGGNEVPKLKKKLIAYFSR